MPDKLLHLSVDVFKHRVYARVSHMCKHLARSAASQDAEVHNRCCAEAELGTFSSGVQVLDLETFVSVFAGDGWAELGKPAERGRDAAAVWWSAGRFPDLHSPAYIFEVSDSVLMCQGDRALAAEAYSNGAQFGVVTTLGSAPADGSSLAAWLAPLLIFLGVLSVEHRP